MLPPVSTRNLLTAIEKKRRDDAALRWNQSFQPGRRPAGTALRDASPQHTAPQHPAPQQPIRA